MSLHVETTGDGPDVVLLHGWGMNGAVWNELVSLLSPRFRLHAVDLPGHGESVMREMNGIDDVADHVARHAPKRCAACGWSLGGQVALAWARRAPSQVTRLALIATSPCFVQREDWPHAITAVVWRDFAEALAHDSGATLRRFVALQAKGDARTGRVVRRLREVLSPQADANALQQGLAILLRTDLRQRLCEVAQPTLVMHGGQDALTPPAAAAYLSKALADARLAMIDGAAHAPFVSDPGAAARHLTAFLGRR